MQFVLVYTTIQVKREVNEKTSQNASDGLPQSFFFRFKVFYVAWSEPQRKREAEVLNH